MAKKSTTDDNPKPQPNRSPAWVVYARLDPDLEAPVQAYINAQEYPPATARVIERALKELLEKHGQWPPKRKPKPGNGSD